MVLYHNIIHEYYMVFVVYKLHYIVLYHPIKYVMNDILYYTILYIMYINITNYTLYIIYYMLHILY